MFTLYILVFGILLALLEIEIEGKHGWAKNLPTWRKDSSSSLVFLRSITGYHSILFLMILFLNHIVYIGFFGWSWIIDELMILSFHFFLVIYWDFLWFVLNPHYTYKKFKKEHIAWYTDSSWIAWFPIDYWYAIAFSGGLVGLRFVMDGAHTIIDEYLLTCIIGIIIWVGLIFISPLYHKFYNFMRQ